MPFIRTTKRHKALDRLLQARRLDARARLLVRRSGRAEAHLALVLSVMDRDRLWRPLGHKNLNAYARKIADWSACKTSRMVKLVRDLQTLPEMSRQFYRGELPWTKACVAAGEAAKDPTTDTSWCERVRDETRLSLERRARLAAGLSMLHNYLLQLDDDQQAWYDDAFAALQREGKGALTPAQVFSEACRRMVQGGTVSAGPRPLVAYGVCAKCNEATHGTDTRSADKVSGLCNADVIDFTTNPPSRGRSIPADVAARVLARDQTKCRVPDCNNRTWIDIHHEGGVRNVGHDPEKMITLCGSHHDARHDGALNLTFDSGRVIFSLADGELVGEVDLRVLPAGPSATRREKQACTKVVYPGKGTTREIGDAPGAMSTPDETSVSDARRALVALGIGSREATTLIANAGPCSTTELLVKEALRRRPA